MTRMSASEAKDGFAETLNRVAYSNERVLVERHGKDVAAIISIEDLRLFPEDHPPIITASK